MAQYTFTVAAGVGQFNLAQFQVQRESTIFVAYDPITRQDSSDFATPLRGLYSFQLLEDGSFSSNLALPLPGARFDGGGSAAERLGWRGNVLRIPGWVGPDPIIATLAMSNFTALFPLRIIVDVRQGFMPAWEYEYDLLALGSIPIADFTSWVANAGPNNLLVNDNAFTLLQTVLPNTRVPVHPDGAIFSVAAANTAFGRAQIG